MKILLSAYACEPNRGSEEGVGWNVVTQAAKYHEVWVLTRSFYQASIEAELGSRKLNNIHFVYFDPLNWTSDWRDTQGSVQLHYYLWQIQAYFMGRSLCHKFRFDLFHHVTYGKYWSPSFLSLLPIPFVWGPVGGGDVAPSLFWSEFSVRGKLYEIARSTAQKLGELDPFTRITARQSAVTLATTDGTLNRVQRLGSNEIKIFSQVALSESEIQNLSKLELPDGEPFRFVSIGRLLHWKGFHLGLHAFAQARIPRSEYWFFGDGAEKSYLESLAKSLGIYEQVHFWGKLNREDMFSKLRQCHVLVHPSLHEAGGFVCAEMMAAGRPVICLDLGGPAIQVTPECGFKVPANSPQQAVQDIALAMNRLASDPELYQQMSRTGKNRVQDIFNWDYVGQAINQIYEAVKAEQTLEASESATYRKA